MAETRKNFSWNWRFFNRGTLFFGVRAEDFNAQAKKYTAFVRFLGGAADFSIQEAKSFALEAENIAVEPNDLGGQAETFAVEANHLDSEANRLGFKPNRLGSEANRLGVEANRLGRAPNHLASEPNRLGIELNHLGVEPKRLGLQPKDSSAPIKIFTFGLFVLTAGSRISAGYIKRRQVLVKA